MSCLRVFYIGGRRKHGSMTSSPFLLFNISVLRKSYQVIDQVGKKILSKSKFKLGNIVGLKTAVQIVLLVLLLLWHSKRDISQNLIHFRWIYWTPTAWLTEGLREQKRTRTSLHTQTSDEADLLRGRNEGLVCQTGKIARAVPFSAPYFRS